MSREPLLTVDSFEQPPDPGRPPKLDWLPIASLMIETDYQRPVTPGGMNNIKRIMAAFSWSRFSPVIVRRVPGPHEIYEVIDGQHRSIAAKACGYERVPAMIVHCTDEEAAKIFAAVNGNVTPMQPLAVYKAALAGREKWAIECEAAAKAAGCHILTYALPKSKQKPLQTLSVSAVRTVWRTHNPKVLEATFRLLQASKGAEVPGFLTSFLILHWGRILASRPGWIENIERVRATISAMGLNLTLEEPAAVEARIEKRIGDGRQGEALIDIKTKVAELLGRKWTSPQIIATQLRLPYAEVNRIIEEIRATKLLQEAPR